MRLFAALTGLGFLVLSLASAQAATRPDRVAKQQVRAMLDAAKGLHRQGPQTIRFAGGEIHYTPGKGTTAIFDNGAIATSTYTPTLVTPHPGAQLPTTHEGVLALLRGGKDGVPGAPEGAPPGTAPLRTTKRRFLGTDLRHTERTFADGSTLSIGTVHIGDRSSPRFGQQLSSSSHTGPWHPTQPNQWSGTMKATQYRGADGTFGPKDDDRNAAPVGSRR